MERKWYFNIAWNVLLCVLAVLAALPTIFPKPKAGEPDPLPQALRKAFPGINLGLDLQGGLRLIYEVEVAAAVEDKRDRIAQEIVDRLKEKAKINLTFERRDESERFVLNFEKAADRDRTEVKDLLRDYRQSVVIEGEAEKQISCTLSEAQAKETRDLSVSQAKETISNRIDELGLANTSVADQDIDIIVEIPGVDEAEVTRIKRIISMTARLEFKIVDESGSEAYFSPMADKLDKEGPIKLQREQVQDGSGGQVWSYYLEAKDEPSGKSGRQVLKDFLKDKPVPENRSLGFQRNQGLDDAGQPTADVTWRTYYMERTPGITGEHVDNAVVMNDDNSGQPYVSLSFDAVGAQIFSDLTEKNVKRRMAIQLDDKVNSAPVIQEKIGGGTARITLGGYEAYNKLFQEAQELVMVLRAGALPAPLKPITESSVGPALGRDSIAMGRIAFIAAFISVLAFMWIYYRASGFAANISLTVNALWIFGVVSAFGATMTLPGIAALILTLGMAVDANVIIYERIREELRAGKAPRAAVEAGYNRAFWTVFDSQVTTFIAGVVLLQYGTGAIKGFAVTLLIGIITSIISAIVISRILLDWFTRRRADRLSI